MSNARKGVIFVSILSLVALIGPRIVHSHCEIPCGIYGDVMRISALYEDIATIEKSMNQIMELSKAKEPNWNQLVRWVTNKEEHANKVQHIVTQYFMTQRLKPDNAKYIKLLTTLHAMLIEAMKTKQTTDLSHVGKLRHLVGELSKDYFSEQDLKHIRQHHPEGK